MGQGSLTFAGDLHKSTVEKGCAGGIVRIKKYGEGKCELVCLAPGRIKGGRGMQLTWSKAEKNE